MATAQHPDGYLFDLYRRYIGEPDERRDVYLGFGLFLGGIGLGIVALALFVWSSTLEPHTTEYYRWVQPSYVLGMLALPAMMLGTVVLLPAERRVTFASVGGVAITAVAVAGFVHLYPLHWNFYGGSETAFSTVHVVAVYAVGMASIVASTGAALIAHYLDMARSSEVVEVGDDEDEAEETVSDEQIRDDIDEAMEGVELTWGGVEETENRQLSFSDHEFDVDSIDAGAVTRVRSRGVDDQVAGLKGLKGGDTTTTTSTKTVDDQTQKLRELREQQAEDEDAETGSIGPGGAGGTLERFKRRFGVRLGSFTDRLASRIGKYR